MVSAIRIRAHPLPHLPPNRVPQLLMPVAEHVVSTGRRGRHFKPHQYWLATQKWDAVLSTGCREHASQTRTPPLRTKPLHHSR